MVDAARQMLDELMGRNRNLHPSEAPRKISWDDPDYCQYYVVKFCPHDLFINTRADLGPCTQIHDDEAKRLYEEARPSPRKRAYEDEFLRFCNNMLNDVDRKIQKGKQRLQLMNRDNPVASIPLSKYQEQLNNMNARIKKLLVEAEEAGIRGDVDQAKDLMTLCEQLKDDKEAMVAQHEQQQQINQANGIPKEPSDPPQTEKLEGEKSPKSVDGSSTSGSAVGEKKLLPWMQDLGTLPEKQMEVCEICGAFLIVGDAQQRIEDHLMGKQHLGYSRLRKAIEELHERRQKEREEEERKRREEREQRNAQRSTHSSDRKREHRDRDRDRDQNRDRDRKRDDRGRSREHSSRRSPDRHRHHHKSSHRKRSRSRSSHRRSHTSRSRSRSHY